MFNKKGKLIFIGIVLQPTNIGKLQLANSKWQVAIRKWQVASGMSDQHFFVSL